MAEPPVIRPLAEADAHALAALHLRVWRAAYGHLVQADELDRVDLEERAQQWRRTARGEAEPARSALVADDRGSLVGFVAYGAPRGEMPAGTGEVLAIYVDEPWWGSDVGHRLLSAAREALASSGYDRFYLWVLEQNPRARRFYERAGLAPDGERQPIEFLGVELPELRYVGPSRL